MLHKECIVIIKNTECTFQGDHKLNLSYTIHQGSQTCCLPVHFTWPSHQSFSHYSVKELFLCFLSWAWKLKKVCHPWMAMYNTPDKREQCSNYNIFWFLFWKVWSILHRVFNFNKLCSSPLISKLSVSPALLQFETPYSSLFSIFSMLRIRNNNLRKGNSINYRVHQ